MNATVEEKVETNEVKISATKFAEIYYNTVFDRAVRKTSFFTAEHSGPAMQARAAFISGYVNNKDKEAIDDDAEIKIFGNIEKSIDRPNGGYTDKIHNDARTSVVHMLTNGVKSACNEKEIRVDVQEAIVKYKQSQQPKKENWVKRNYKLLTVGFAALTTAGVGGVIKELNDANAIAKQNAQANVRMLKDVNGSVQQNTSTVKTVGAEMTSAVNHSGKKVRNAVLYEGNKTASHLDEIKKNMLPLTPDSAINEPLNKGPEPVNP